MLCESACGKNANLDFYSANVTGSVDVFLMRFVAEQGLLHREPPMGEPRTRGIQLVAFTKNPSHRRVMFVAEQGLLHREPLLGEPRTRGIQLVAFTKNPSHRRVMFVAEQGLEPRTRGL